MRREKKKLKIKEKKNKKKINKKIESVAEWLVNLMVFSATGKLIQLEIEAASSVPKLETKYSIKEEMETRSQSIFSKRKL